MEGSRSQSSTSLNTAASITSSGTASNWEDIARRLKGNISSGAPSESGQSESLADIFAPNKRRYNPYDFEKRPIIRNGHCIPRSEALLMDMICANKATLQSQLETTKHPIVGLDEVIEYLDPDQVSPRVYHCKLCKIWNSVQSVMTHLTGYNHRVKYIWKKFPNEVKAYLMHDGKTINRSSPLMLMAQKRCAELELVYGRGEITTKKEKPVIGDEELDGPENDFINVNEGKQTETLKKILAGIKSIKLETDEDARIAKQIINVMTDAICEHQIQAPRKLAAGGATPKSILKK